MHTDIHASSGIRTTIPVFEMEKTVHDLDRVASVIGMHVILHAKYHNEFVFLDILDGGFEI
jgi:hypothetical protein